MDEEEKEEEAIIAMARERGLSTNCARDICKLRKSPGWNSALEGRLIELDADPDRGKGDDWLDFGTADYHRFSEGIWGLRLCDDGWSRDNSEAMWKIAGLTMLIAGMKLSPVLNLLIAMFDAASKEMHFYD